MLYRANYIKGQLAVAAQKVGRLAWVDHARGIAILLVVYRHDVIGMKNSGIEVSSLMYNMQEVFYNFRMPVFFVLSGIFIAGSLARKKRGAILKDRAQTILYPYLLWATLMILMQIYFSRYANAKKSLVDLKDIILQPRNVDHLWYLLALFNTSVLYLGLSKLVKSRWGHGAIAIGMYLLSVTKWLEGNSLLADILYFYIYLYAGVLLSEFMLNDEKRDAILNPRKLFWVLPLFILGQYFWFEIRDVQKEFVYELPLLLVNLLACYFIYLISFQISKSRNSGWLAYLGKHSLYIYILHVFVMSFIRTLISHTHIAINPWGELTICWVCGLLIPVILFQSLKGVGFERLFSLKPKGT